MENLRPSMRDIARRLNVSHATVSMALRNNPRISKARREEVHRIAKEIGYRPDPILSALVSYRQRKQAKPVVSALAWINRWKDPRKLRGHKEFDSYWQGACAAAEVLGYRIEELVVDEDMKGRRLKDILFARGIQGLLIPPHEADPYWVDLGLELDNFCVVRFGFSISDLRADMIGNDQMRSAELAVARIYQSGYRALGYFSDELFDAKTDGNFRMGALRGLENHGGMARVEPLILTARMGEGDGDPKLLKHLMDWIDSNRLDSILTSDIALTGSLKQIGIRVPRDLGLALTSVREVEGNHSGLDQNPFQIGQIAVQVLVDKINRSDNGEPEYCRRVLVEGHWVDGDTLPPLSCRLPPRGRSEGRKEEGELTTDGHG
ncbi:MAG: LacI family DNA-binding transcriptional regulator [Opitutae bacterium]|nr:LacI family DNA-binding transcriptional regulator [Opitutae bacterium]